MLFLMLFGSCTFVTAKKTKNLVRKPKHVEEFISQPEKKPYLVITSLTNLTPFNLAFFDRVQDTFVAIKAGEEVSTVCCVEKFQYAPQSPTTYYQLADFAQFVVAETDGSGEVLVDDASFFNIDFTKSAVTDGTGAITAFLAYKALELCMAGPHGRCVRSSKNLQNSNCDTVEIHVVFYPNEQVQLQGKDFRYYCSFDLVENEEIEIY